jgi:hypothetical protein
VQGADALFPFFFFCGTQGVVEVGNEGLSILDALLQRLGLICARAAAVSDRCVYVCVYVCVFVCVCVCVCVCE